MINTSNVKYEFSKNKMELDDFIKYAKEKFDCEVSVEKSVNPDTFDKIFGDVVEDNCMEISKIAIENMIREK